MPAEWEPHERTIMGWPCREELWGETLAQARSDYATVANAIAAFEPVTMIANPGAQAQQARAACGAGVEIMELALDDSWLRDCGPIYVLGEDGQRVAVHFRFNGWGEKFAPWDRDAGVDGLGRMLTTEQCLLNPNRNAALSREQIEQALERHLGVAEIVWLGRGLVEDRDTDGHVDLIAAFTPARKVMLQVVGHDNPNYDRYEENRARLGSAGLEVVEMPFLPYAQVAGETVAVSHLNFYICNGAVIVPVAGAGTDAEALSILAAAYPARDVIPVPGTVLAYGGGGPHCITQQVPAPPTEGDDG
jgi:agmatine deiminase